MALTRQQKRSVERLLNGSAKIEFIAEKQRKERQLIADRQDYIDLCRFDIERNAKISKRAEVVLLSILIVFSYAFFIHG